MKTALSLFLALVLPVAGHADELKPVNVETMLSGYCYAGSRPDKKAPGGYGRSGNTPRPATVQYGKSGSVDLVALPGATVPFRKSYRGFCVLLVNRTKSEVSFPASDSRIPIIQEALDSKGQWRPIEYLPESWCGNSLHRVFLPPQHYWTFAAPVYTGKFRTRLRFALRCRPSIYSNEVEGSINPRQFK